MKRLILATATAAALMAGVSAASAQSYHEGYHHGPRGPFVERGVGLQVGPVGIGVYDNSRIYDNRYVYRHDRSARDNSYESNYFRSHEYFPQSPPGGGY